MNEDELYAKLVSCNFSYRRVAKITRTNALDLRRLAASRGRRVSVIAGISKKQKESLFADLGKKYDKVIAYEYGITASCVRGWRLKKNIPCCRIHPEAKKKPKPTPRILREFGLQQNNDPIAGPYVKLYNNWKRPIELPKYYRDEPCQTV